jgi:carboxypeptidase PM20D1
MKIFLIILAAIIVLLAVLIIRAAKLKQPETNKNKEFKTYDDKEAIKRFQTILQQKTVWNRDASKIDYSSFDCFLDILKNTYPKVFNLAEVNTVNKYGIIIKLNGNDSSLDSAILMGHYDVVAADENEWKYPPFGAEIHGGTIYARGAVDTKCIMCAVLEAISKLIDEGFTPKRDIYIISTNNEEIGGDTTPAMVDWFKQKNIKPYIVLDEGGAVTDALPLGVKTPFAMIGVSEKGVADVKLTVKCKGGHSSAPSNDDACVQLIKALNNIIDHPHKSKISPVVKTMFISLAKYTSFIYKIIFANLWLFSPIVKKIMKSGSTTNAMLATTDALTMLNGSTQINVLPSEASAGFSVRVAPGETVDEAVKHITESCKNENVKIDVMYRFEPSPISNYNSEQYSLLYDTVKSVYTDADISPYVMNGGTDSKHFAVICNYVYRFAGFEFSGEERAGIHSINEGLRAEKYLKGVKFYQELLKKM